MSQRLSVNESTPLLSPGLLHSTMEQQAGRRHHSTTLSSPGFNTFIQPSVEDAHISTSISPHLSPLMQDDDQDGSMPLLLTASPNPTLGQHHEERELDHRAASNSPHVGDESTPPFFPSPLYSSSREQHEHSSALPSLPAGWSPGIQHTVGDHRGSNIIMQQAEIQQPGPFSLSVPTKSTIMLRRNAQAESANAGRSSASPGTLQNVDPQRVRKLISRLGLDKQRSELLSKIVIATAPFHKTELPPTQPAAEKNNPEDDALREVLGSLLFAPTSSITTIAAEGTPAGESPENPTGNLLFDTNVADDLGPHPIEPGSDSPPLLWSTAAVEEPLDPNAEDPTYFTVAEFINTVIEKGIQVESVTDEDWCIEELRVAILNHLMNNVFEEEFTADGGSDEEAVTTEEATEQVNPKDTSKSDLMADGDSSEILVFDRETSEQVKVKGGTSQADPSVEQDSSKLGVTREEAIKKIQTGEDTPELDLESWKKQGQDGWLKRDDGTDMNEEEIDEECARWDAMVRKTRIEKKAEMATPSLGKDLDPKDKGFWAYMRSSKQKEEVKRPTSTHGQEDKISATTHGEHDEASQKKSKKGSRKNKNKNRKAKKAALKGEDREDESEQARETETFSRFLDLPTKVGKKVLGFILVVAEQDLVPYHYVEGKVVKNIGLRKRPELNILLALCSSNNKVVKRCLDDARNILYRDNIFSIRKPNDLIMFLGTIGGDNVARLKMGKNLLLSDRFFNARHRYELEMRWLARWGEDLLFAMKGFNIIRSDIAAENSEDDLTCEPTDVEKALKSMVEVLRDEGKINEALKENDTGSGSSSSPMRLQSLDLGEKFDSLAEQIKTMDLATGDSEVMKSDTAKMQETDVPQEAMESMSQKWKRKALEAGKTVKDESEVDGYGKAFLELVTNSYVEDEDVLNQDS